MIVNSKRIGILKKLAIIFSKRKYTKIPDNQLIKLDNETEHQLAGIVNSFDAPIQYSFAYGSGIFKQAGYSEKHKPQIDIILAVSDTNQFHSINLQQNSNHYSTLKYFNGTLINKFQNLGAGIYFNPFVTINGVNVKYGVISVSNLIKDLSDWETFYVAGRLQKPVKIIKNDPQIQYLNQLNLKGAATLAKYISLKNSEDGKIDEFKFYENITGLSYFGDFRFKLGGENPNKVHNIVISNFEYFQRYYKPIYEDIVLNDSFYLPDGITLDNAKHIIRQRTRKFSASQAVKGIFTAGITKSVKYAWAKRLKALQGRMQ
ncbi:hypothetical protein TBLA_0A05480 [Henningerozyma blattae CBS 6284]|uniref:Phosphatidate cytidylyltransferase, mitochondrial n=1 Tax=Henningerozyma blattae (strain ATCC 34711 / CBS 6284 / DSM 70876 / NBRC 10599 / NRRL Y-10934 / UCD 77-7) TaxID=1071380 RepID=I2GW39_HENB6|nr:hypothetical protein TBLA_0A05480 [Tetrapisispora blattae CBS 6284]CCH58341.1 hypothetical protein TBLA_0A05480 [Tetrapisispora blattae CBS 6284]